MLIYIFFRRLQQEYQTAYHKSFRVSDILPGETGMRNLIDACHGIKVDEIRRIFPSISMSTLPFIHLSIHLPIIYPSVHTIHQSIHSPINPSVLPSDSTHQPYIHTLAIINHPSIHDINLFIHLSIHPFTHQSICLSIHLQYIIYHSGVHTFLHPSIYHSFIHTLFFSVCLPR